MHLFNKDKLKKCIIFVFYIYIGIFPSYLCEGVRFLDIEVTDSGELAYGRWELSLGPLNEKLVLLTTDTSFQTLKIKILKFSLLLLLGPKFYKSPKEE